MEANIEPAINPDPETVAAVAEKSPVSCNPALFLKEYYYLPPSLKGIRTLDAGGGGSDFSAWLSTRGAKPMAIDTLYSDIGALEARIKATVLADLNAVRKRSGSSPMTFDDPAIRDYLEKSASFQDFKRSHQQKTVTYIPGSFTDIDLPDESVDMAFAYLSLFGAADAEYNILERSFDEVIRTLRKKGGSLQVGPFLAQGSPTSRMRNQMKVKEKLETRDDLTVSSKRVLYAPGTPLESNELRLTVVKK